MNTMKMIQYILGATAAEGISAKSGNPYKFGVLFQPVPIRTWNNENGKAVAAGVVTPEKNDDAVICTLEMMETLDSMKGSLPAFLELDMQPNPENFKELICVGFEVKAVVPTDYEEFTKIYHGGLKPSVSSASAPAKQDPRS